MLASLFGYFFSMIAMLTAFAVLLTSFSNISTLGKGRHHLRPPVISRTVTVDQAAQSQSPVAQETSPAKDVSAILSTAKADAKKVSITSPKLSLVSTTTTAMGTRGVMPKDTAQEVFFSASYKSRSCANTNSAPVAIGFSNQSRAVVEARRIAARIAKLPELLRQA